MVYGREPFFWVWEQLQVIVAAGCLLRSFRLAGLVILEAPCGQTGSGRRNSAPVYLIILDVWSLEWAAAEAYCRETLWSGNVSSWPLRSRLFGLGARLLLAEWSSM